MSFAAVVTGALGLKVSDMKIINFANSFDPDVAAHNESSHLDVYCLPCSL